MAILRVELFHDFELSSYAEQNTGECIVQNNCALAGKTSGKQVLGHTSDSACREKESNE